MQPEVQCGGLLELHLPSPENRYVRRVNSIVIRSDYAFLTLAPAPADPPLPPTTKPTPSGREAGAPQTSKGLRPNFICTDRNIGVILAL